MLLAPLGRGPARASTGSSSTRWFGKGFVRARVDGPSSWTAAIRRTSTKKKKHTIEVVIRPASRCARTSATASRDSLETALKVGRRRRARRARPRARSTCFAFASTPAPSCGFRPRRALAAPVSRSKNSPQGAPARPGTGLGVPSRRLGPRQADRRPPSARSPPGRPRGASRRGGGSSAGASSRSLAQAMRFLAHQTVARPAREGSARPSCFGTENELNFAFVGERSRWEYRGRFGRPRPQHQRRLPAETTSHDTRSEDRSVSCRMRPCASCGGQAGSGGEAAGQWRVGGLHHPSTSFQLQVPGGAAVVRGALPSPLAS